MLKEPVIDLDVAKEHGLSEEEYTKIIEILGREPNYVELGIFSVMWSEHCSYKSSIKMLKTLPRDGERLLVGAGEENAGLVEVAIYNVTGQRVATLHNDITSAGYHTYTFDAQNLSSGQYFVRVTAPGFSDVRPMTFLK